MTPTTEPPALVDAATVVPGLQVALVYSTADTFLTLAGPDDRPLDMGTPFNDFGEAAQPRAQQVANRLVLRGVVVRAGLYPLDHEWWHFDCAPRAEARRRYPRIP